MTDIIEFYAKSRKEWREWLRKNHNKEKKVFLIKYKKHTGKPSLSHKESMEEAICFGWIDTIVKKVDKEKYKRCFVKRNENSRWSNNTRRYAEELIEKKLMTKAGLKIYKHGLKKPTFDHDRPKNPEPPEDLLQQLNKNKIAKEFFATLAPSYRRVYIYQIITAKRPETRKKRIMKVYERAKLRMKPND
jgi:uncharacterized protein YdeI (YjbR/CyaY-like superfamily)